MKVGPPARNRSLKLNWQTFVILICRYVFIQINVAEDHSVVLKENRFNLLGAFRKTAKWNFHFCHVCLSVRMEQLALHRTDTHLLTPWSRVLLEKLTGFAANQEIPRILWNTEGSLTHSQVSATCLYSEPVRSSP